MTKVAKDLLRDVVGGVPLSAADDVRTAGLALPPNDAVASALAAQVAQESAIRSADIVSAEFDLETTRISDQRGEDDE